MEYKFINESNIDEKQAELNDILLNPCSKWRYEGAKIERLTLEHLETICFLLGVDMNCYNSKEELINHYIIDMIRWEIEYCDDDILENINEWIGLYKAIYYKI